MSDQWKPGDKAVVDDPASPRHRLIVWLVSKWGELDGGACWGVSDTPGGEVVDAFEESQIHPATQEAASKWLDRCLEAGAVAFVIATFAWLFLGKGCG